MAKECVVTDTIVLRVALDWLDPDPSAPRLTSLQSVTAILSAFPRLAPDTIFIIFGRAHQLVLPHRANPDQGTQWIPNLSDGGTLELVLSRVDEPAQRVWLRYDVYREQGRIDLADPESWLAADYNPTTILAGNNVLPVTIADAETGEIDVHVTRGQWASYFPADVPAFLQMLQPGPRT
jgi:hypothetical protein